MATYTPSYNVSWIGITFRGVKIPFLRLNVNIPNLQANDIIDFGSNFSTNVSGAVLGVVTTCGLYMHDVPLNPWGFVNGSKAQTGDNQFTTTTNVVLSDRHGSINCDLYHYDGTAWRTLNYGGQLSGGYTSHDNYYCVPVFLIYNTANDKYVWISSKRGSALYYAENNPGITNDDNTPVSLVTGTPYDLANNNITVGGDFTLQGIEELTKDPYEPGGESGTGGGTGDFDGTGDDIDIPSLPTLSATDTGFITLFNPSTGQLQSLANYMWSSGFDIDTFKKLFADPMDCILGLSIVPVAVPNGSTKTVKVGNISTGVSMTVAASQYVEVDCGTLNVNEFWGAYLDYDPYTKAEIYLPYIGTHPLAVDDIMAKAVHVVYHVDILSGACTAFVKCGGSVLYEFIGQCSSSIPITGNDWTNVINGVISIAGAIGSMVATGGASAPMAAGMIASTAVNGMKPNVEKSGSMSGTGGILAVQTPYLILTRPRQALPANQNRFMGYPSFITRKLSSIHGYTEIESVHLEGIPATEQELSEIETLLKGGVIF